MEIKDEYIKRSSVMPAVEDVVELYPSEYEAIADAINKIPTTDVVEVVHCKNCAYWDRRWTTGRCESPRNGLIYEYTNEDDYCSYGKKDGAE